MKKHFGLISCALFGCAVVASFAWSQDRGSYGDRGGDRGSSGGDRSRGGFDSGSSSSGNNSTGSNSGSSSSSNSDRDRDRDRSDRDRERDRERERERERSNSSSKPAAPAVPGFGVATTVPKAAGFDVPLSVDTSIPLEKRYDTRVIEYVDKMLKDYDKNSDGYVDNIEWKEGRWSTPPEESDTNRDGKLSKAELCERIARRFGLQNSPQGSGGSSSGSSDRDRDRNRDSGSSSNSGGDFAKFKDYATSLIKQHDQNKNGVLEKDEWRDLKSEHRAADANNDGVITVDELALKLQAYSSGSSSSSSANSYSSKAGSTSSSDSQKRGWGGWGNKSSTTKPTEKKDYRFQTATDRLPKGLPDWFLRSDVDADGQVAMVEYSTSWSDATAAEFQKYDLDGDGFITPEEVLTTLASSSTLKK
jgi:Ca2+-binding EF-hand superfamily protein